MKFSNCWYESVCTIEDCNTNTCVRYLEMAYLMDSSGIPKNRQLPDPLTAPKVDLGAYRRLAEIKDNIVEFVDEGKSLYLTSSYTGNGKTSWAIKLMTKYFNEIWDGNGFKPRGVIIHVPTFLLKCKDFKNNDREFEETKKLLGTVDLVIWDDIGGLSSQYDYTQLLVAIDARSFAGKSNIFTGNINTPESMEENLGAKITSRIWNSQTEIIEFKGGDNR